MQPYVFISYARKQYYVAEELATSLRLLDLAAWLDVQEIAPGVDWYSEILHGIEGCEALVLVASRGSHRSGPVQEEVAAARAAGKPIYVALIDNSLFLEELKGSATIIDCRSGFYDRMHVLAKAIRAGDQSDSMLSERRFFLPRLPFGFVKYVQLLLLTLFFVLGTIFIIALKQVSVTTITPQALPLVIFIGTPLVLWFLSLGYSFYQLLGFRYQRDVTYTALDLWPVFCLFVGPALYFLILTSYDTSILGLSFNLGFSVTSRAVLDPLPLTAVITVFVTFLFTYVAMLFTSVRNLLLVLLAGMPLTLLVASPIPAFIKYPLLLLLGGTIAYTSMRGSLTGKGVDFTGGGISIPPNGFRQNPLAGQHPSLNWVRWLTPGSLVHLDVRSSKLQLRERQAISTAIPAKTWHLHYQPADRGCVEAIRRILSGEPALEETPLEEAYYHIVVISSRTSRRWLDALTAAYGPVICVVVSAIALGVLARPLHQNQWVDFRRQRPEQLAYLARALAGGDAYVNPTTPENLERPLGPYPVGLVSQALRISGLVSVILGAASLFIMGESALAPFSLPQAALSILIGALAFWEAERLRVRASSTAALLVATVLTWLNIGYWLVRGSLFALAPRALLVHNGSYNQFLTGGMAIVIFFIGVPLGFLFLVGWIEFFRGFAAVAHWLPRRTLPSLRPTLMPPVWKRFDIINAVYALVILLITTMLVVNSPYQYPEIHEYDVQVADMDPLNLVYGGDGKVWFDVSGNNNAGYGLGYILPDGTINPVQFLTPQPSDCEFSPFSSSSAAILLDCYEGSGLQVGPDQAFWYVTRMLYDPSKVQIVRMTPAGTAKTFPLNDTNGVDVHFTFDAAGNTWFTQADNIYANQYAANIGRIDTAGHVTQFPIMVGSELTSIVAEPDGTVWFTDAGRGSVGQITATGKVTEYPTPATNKPDDIIAGADHHVWYVGVDSSVIGRMASNGTSQLFPQPAKSVPQNLVWGPDGAVWFLDTGLDAISRVTTTGVTTRFRLPEPINNPVLIVGSDGNLWCALAHAVARITPAGIITQYPIPTLDATITAMVSSPNHHIWFVEDTGESGLIGEVVTTATTTTGAAEYVFRRIPGPPVAGYAR